MIDEYIIYNKRINKLQNEYYEHALESSYATRLRFQRPPEAELPQNPTVLCPTIHQPRKDHFPIRECRSYSPRRNA